jgi:hypothetical protein
MMVETPHVILIHGTWGGRESGRVVWWELAESEPNFASALQDYLSKGPLSGAIWRGFAAGEEFHWSGNNHRQARFAAARSLSVSMLKIQESDPSARFYFIAHSHGGNVLLAAIGSGLKAGLKISNIRRIAFLGTPFVSKRWSRRRFRDIILTVLATFLITSFYISQMIRAIASGRHLTVWEMALFAYTVIFILAWLWSAVQTSKDPRIDTNLYFDEAHHKASLQDKGIPMIDALVVNAGLRDEAYLTLSSHTIWSLYLLNIE